jgi:hypothetical protein
LLKEKLKVARQSTSERRKTLASKCGCKISGIVMVEMLPVWLLQPAIPNPTENLMPKDLARREYDLSVDDRFACPLALD